jgi:hypothetical protein
VLTARNFSSVAPGVDDLVRRLGPARRARDHVAGAQRPGVAAEAQLPRAFDDVEHLLVEAVVVEGEGALARRQHGHVVAQLFRTERRRERRHPAAEALLGHGAALAARHLGQVEVLRIGDVQDRSRHGGLLGASRACGGFCPGRKAAHAPQGTPGPVTSARPHAP